MLEHFERAAEVADEIVTAASNAPNRRALLAIGGAALLAGLPREANAQAKPPGWEAAVNWNSPTNRLVRRITMGIDEVETVAAVQLGFRGYLERQLNWATIDDSAADRAVIARFPRATWTIAQLWDRGEDWISLHQYRAATVFRAMVSKRQLHQRMVEFWTDHFNVNGESVGGTLLISLVRDVIRKHALGNFYDLLSGVAHSPAMLTFLDNDDNSFEAPNINYARELHELHTVGSDGGYVGRDLHQAAAALTGWTWTRDSRSPNRGKFKFEEDDHKPGNKKVMTLNIPSGGQDEGEKLIRYLADHPNTARFITKKLIRWFLGEGAPDSVWTAAQTAFKNTRGDIKAVLRVILTPQNLMAATPKFKRPFHLIVSALRSTKASVNNFDSLLWGYLPRAGMRPFDWFPPDGFPDKFHYWATAQAPRMDFVMSLGSNAVWEVSVEFERLFRNNQTPVGMMNAINTRLFGNEMSTGDKNALLAFLTAKGFVDQERLRAAVSLAMASPSFQWY